jgi:hypothetical protein
MRRSRRGAADQFIERSRLPAIVEELEELDLHLLAGN